VSSGTLNSSIPYHTTAFEDTASGGGCTWPARHFAGVGQTASYGL